MALLYPTALARVGLTLNQTTDNFNRVFRHVYSHMWHIPVSSPPSQIKLTKTEHLKDGKITKPFFFGGEVGERWWYGGSGLSRCIC